MTQLGAIRQSALDDIVLGAMTTDPARDLDAAVTTPFMRYEGIEIAAQPRRFVRTVKTSKPYEPAWFDPSEHGLATLEEPEPFERKESWRWLAISLACGGLAVAVLAAISA